MIDIEQARKCNEGIKRLNEMILATRDPEEKRRLVSARTVAWRAQEQVLGAKTRQGGAKLVWMALPPLGQGWNGKPGAPPPVGRTFCYE